MTIVETRPITGGVATHLDAHVAAALDGNGGVFGVASFPTTVAGFAALAGWLAGFGPIAGVGVEGTGAYGAGLARHLRGLGLEVIEVDRPNRQVRRSPASPTPSTRWKRPGRCSPAAPAGSQRPPTIGYLTPSSLSTASYAWRARAASMWSPTASHAASRNFHSWSR